jgi:hypothetical protein
MRVALAAVLGVYMTYEVATSDVMQLHRENLAWFCAALFATSFFAVCTLFLSSRFARRFAP